MNYDVKVIGRNGDDFVTFLGLSERGIRFIASHVSCPYIMGVSILRGENVTKFIKIIEAHGLVIAPVTFI